MNKKILTDLGYPIRNKGYMCKGKLTLGKHISFRRDFSELREGIVKCTGCGTEYPILEDILIVRDDSKNIDARITITLLDYVRLRVDSVRKCIWGALLPLDRLG